MCLLSDIYTLITLFNCTLLPLVSKSEVAHNDLRLENEILFNTSNQMKGRIEKNVLNIMGCPKDLVVNSL
jgi:hypothetical protein